MSENTDTRGAETPSEEPKLTVKRVVSLIQSRKQRGYQREQVAAALKREFGVGAKMFRRAWDEAKKLDEEAAKKARELREAAAKKPVEEKPNLGRTHAVAAAYGPAEPPRQPELVF